MRVCDSGPRKVSVVCIDRCPYKEGVRIKRVSVERGSTVLSTPYFRTLVY